MIKVLIPGPLNIPINRQFPVSENLTWGNCEFVFDKKAEYDYLVVLDSIAESIKTNCPKEKRLIYLGEPPYVKRYGNDFLCQFGNIYSCQKKLVKDNKAKMSIPLLPWMVGCSLKTGTHSCNNLQNYLGYVDFKNDVSVENRLNKICLITSNKTFTKGHRNRVKFVERLQKQYPGLVDVYGNGYNPIGDKWDVLSKYKYSVVIENCCYENYWTEKISDCLLSGCFPLYHGCPNIAEYFPNGSYQQIDINDFDNAISKIKSVLVSNIFEESISQIKEAKCLILDKYNIFNKIANAISEIDKMQSSLAKLQESETLHPYKYTFPILFKQKIAWKFNILLP